MNVVTNLKDVRKSLIFTSWSAGFAIDPSSNSGSLGAAAAHSPWQSELMRYGGKMEIEDALSFM